MFVQPLRYPNIHVLTPSFRFTIIMNDVFATLLLNSPPDITYQLVDLAFFLPFQSSVHHKGVSLVCIFIWIFFLDFLSALFNFSIFILWSSGFFYFYFFHFYFQSSSVIKKKSRSAFGLSTKVTLSAYRKGPIRLISQLSTFITSVPPCTTLLCTTHYQR